MVTCTLILLHLPHVFRLHEANRHASWFARVYTGNYLVDWVRVELERLPPDELLDIFFGERWLLEVEAERRWADRFVVYLMKGCQVWVA